MRINLFVLTLMSCSAVNAQVKKMSAETLIQQVTVFSSGARIERSASVALQPGRSEISFYGLSNQLDRQTLQLKADADITLLSVQSVRDFLSERKIEQEERNFIDRINLLKDKLDLDNRLMDVCKNEESVLARNQAIGGQSGVKAQDLKETLDLQRQRLTEVYVKELDIQKRILNEKQDLERVKAQLQEISRKKDSISYIVTALVETKETRNVNFLLLYNVKDAGWFPTYDVRVNEVSEPLMVLMNAHVFQRSGETWRNITLFLSTGNPNDNATPSLLKPWMLGFYNPDYSARDRMAGYEIRSQARPAALAFSEDKKEKEPSIQTVSVSTQYQPTTIVYKIEDKYNLETDGKTTTIGMRQFEVPAVYDYYSAPKIDAAAFLTAKIINWQDYDLQSGEVSLYYEGTFLGKTYIDLGSVADTLSLSLGKDNGIKVSRKLVKEYSTKKLIGGTRSDSREYEISVRNTKRVPVSMTVMDQYPVSTNREISVEDLKAPDSQVNQETGLLTWSITLAPGQERKLRIGYSVKYPKDKKLVLE